MHACEERDRNRRDQECDASQAAKNVARPRRQDDKHEQPGGKRRTFELNAHGLLAHWADIELLAALRLPILVTAARSQPLFRTRVPMVLEELERMPERRASPDDYIS